MCSYWPTVKGRGARVPGSQYAGAAAVFGRAAATLATTMQSRVRVLSLNALAQSLVTPTTFPQMIIQPVDRRRQIMFEHVARVAPDVICLQEVDDDERPDIVDRFGLDYHISSMSKKQARHSTLTLVKRNSVVVDVAFTDYEYEETTIAMCATADSDDCLMVVNSHLRWEEYGKIAKAQATNIAAVIEEAMDECKERPRVVWCGDFNCTPKDIWKRIPRTLTLRDAFNLEPSPTWCSPRGIALRLDYMLHSPGVRPVQVDRPLRPPPDQDPLRWALQTYGTDHIPLSAVLEFTADPRAEPSRTTEMEVPDV